MKRERLGSRLGFILLSAGCAIGIGNVWRFPYVAGEYGGGAFVFFYIFFLVIMGLPIMTMEFAVGRASRKSIISSFKELERPRQKWHFHGIAGMIGNYLLMMFYTTVAGWMLYYFYLMITGQFVGASPDGVSFHFNEMLSNPRLLLVIMFLVVLLGFLICSLGLEKGVESITKVMMLALLGIMVILAVHSVLLEGGEKGLAFYLLPDFKRMVGIGIWNTIAAAMNQAFFSLSLGIGAMAIFGSYTSRNCTLLGESLNIVVLDTFVAIVAGLIIFPACFAYGVAPDSGPSLIFVTLPNIFASMAGGRLWGTLFFIFMSFASLSTIIAVFENIISCCMDAFGWSRKTACWLNILIVGLLSVPCVLGFNLWSGFQPFGAGSNVLDLEDFMVSNILLPLGSFVYLLFCVTKKGWGWKNYREEANEGKGPKIPQWLRGYVTYILPVILFLLFVQGMYHTFWG